MQISKVGGALWAAVEHVSLVMADFCFQCTLLRDDGYQQGQLAQSRAQHDEGRSSVHRTVSLGHGKGF